MAHVVSGLKGSGLWASCNQELQIASKGVHVGTILQFVVMWAL